MSSTAHKPVATKPLHEWLGRFTILWNDIHFAIFFLFWRLMKKDPERAEAIFFILRSDKAQRELTQSVANAVLEPWPDLKKQVVAALEAVNQLSGRRNAFIHAMWVTDHPNVATVWKPSSKLSQKDVKTEAMALELASLEAEIQILTVSNNVEATLYPNQPRSALAEALLKDFQQISPQQANLGEPNPPKFQSDSSPATE